MTSLYKENGINWALNVLVPTCILLNPSITVIPGPIFMIYKARPTNSYLLLQTQWAMKGSGASKYLEFGPNFAL